MAYLRPFLTILLYLALPATTLSAQEAVCPEGGGQLGFQLENDLRQLSLGIGTDEHYTNGARIDWTGRGVKKGDKLSRLWPFPRNEGSCLLSGFSLGLLMYTPKNLETPDVLPDDRPYAAWLYGGIEATNYTIDRDPADESKADVKKADTFELNLGVLGPGAGGRWFQDGMHDLFNIPSAVGQKYKKPLGWHHQLRNEVGVSARLTRRSRLAGPPAWVENRQRDLLLHFGGTVGNIFTMANAGLTARFGYRVPNDLGPQVKMPSRVTTLRRNVARGMQPSQLQRRPGQASAGEEEPARGPFSLYGFVSTEGRFTLRNAFLDGNLFATDRPDRGHVQKQPFTGDFEFGAAVRFDGGPGRRVWPIRVTYRHVTRSPEFKTPLGLPNGSVPNTWHRYGSIAVMCGKGV